MRAKTRLSTTVALGAAILLAAPAAADWWDWAAPRVDASLVAERDRDDRNREDVVPRGEKERDRARERRGERRDDERWDRKDRKDRKDHDRGTRGRRGEPPHDAKAEAPAFCRTGEGHPVFGMSWCHGDRTGPSFCRTGEGHPKFGMRWCFEKGFVADSARWRSFDPGDVILRDPRRRSERSIFGERTLEEILGDVILGRLVSHRGTLGNDEDLRARWLVPEDRSSARVLQIRAGELPLAELSDLDGDGRVEVALILDM